MLNRRCHTGGPALFSDFLPRFFGSLTARIFTSSTHVNMSKNNYHLIYEAIATSKQVRIKFQHGLGKEIQMDFQPYILGSDIFQHDFVWGYLLFPKTFYKFRLSDIVSILLTEITYTVLPDAVYLYMSQEEHYASLLGFHNVYDKSSISNSPDNQAPQSGAS